MSCSFEVGQLVKVSAELRMPDEDGPLTDPTGLQLKYKYGAGPEVSLVYGVDSALVRDSVGVYHANITLTTAGTLFLRWVATGAVVAASEKHITVAKSAFTTPT